MRNLLPPILIGLSLIGCQGPAAVRRGEAEKIIAKVEAFRTRHQRLPENLRAVGLEEREDSPAYYQKKSDAHYIVWYGEEVGESKIYDSQTGTWK